MGASVRRRGTACRCMLDPMSARFASSCSRNGIREAATLTSCVGETSMYSISEGFDHGEFTAHSGGDQVPGEAALFVQRCVGLGDLVLLLLEGGQILGILGNLPVLDHTVRCFDESELVDAGKGAQGRDEADVRPFRGLDRANPAVVRRVHIAHLEAGPLARESAGAQGAEPSLVRDFAQGVRLVHELRELAGSEELLHDRKDGLCVDEIVGHQRVHFLEAQALPDCLFHADHADAVLVLEQLPDRTHPAVAQVVDVVDASVAVPELQKVLNHRQDVLPPEGLDVQGRIQLEFVVELEPSDFGEVVTVRVEEQVVEEHGGRVEVWRVPRPETPVNLQDRLFLRGDLVDQQGLLKGRADHDVVEVKNGERVDPSSEDLLEFLLRDRFVVLDEDLPRLHVRDVLCRVTPDHVFRSNRDPLHLGVLQLLDGGPQEFLPLAKQNVSGARVLDVLRDVLLFEHLGVEFLGELLSLLDEDLLRFVEMLEKLVGVVPEGLEQNRGRQLSAAIDTDVEDVFRVELEVEPGAPVGDDACREENLARVGLPLVVVEEDAGRAVHLADDHPLGTIDDEGTVLRHERDLSEVDLLFLHVPDALDARVRVLVPLDELDDDLDRDGEGHASLRALVHVVLRLSERILHVLERTGLVEVLDREDASEDLLHADRLSLLGGRLALKEVLVRTLLDIDEVGEIEDFFNLVERSSISSTMKIERIHKCLLVRRKRENKAVGLSLRHGRRTHTETARHG